jgi:ABC-2 type transporter
MRRHLLLSLRLYFRNKMALIYGYLFPVMYFVAFWVLYRFDRLPIARHLGELLTVSVLAGACFGLPTTMVSERERGVWRRYRLTPVPVGSLIASAAAARYLILITAGLLQIGLARAIGAPWPEHPGQLLLVYTLVSFAFIGVGLVIAMLADNVPAVQALGQCIFLPMLIIGGIAVPLSTLPAWAQHVSAFFPGRYAVEALQACVIGPGLRVAGFNVLALVLIGAAGCLAGTKMFRWDAQQRFAAREGKAWLAVAFAAWVAVGLGTEIRGAAKISASTASTAVAPAAMVAPIAAAPAPVASPPVVAPPAALEGSMPAATTATSTGKTAPTPTAAARPANAPAAVDESGPSVDDLMKMKSWQEVNIAQAAEGVAFEHLPSDRGVVTPIATVDDAPEPDVIDQIAALRDALPNWPPGKVPDLVQRTRNLLFVAAVPDVYQMPIERYVPQLVFDRLKDDIPTNDLVKILFWIYLHPNDGDDSAVQSLDALGLANGPSDMGEPRFRASVYALKLMGRLVGKIK